MIGTIAAIIVLGVLIVVHEFGHFIVAKKLGVGVLKFSIGFGPKLIGRVINGTEYVLSAVPLGGFVKMVGEDPDAEEEVDPRTSFSHQVLWKRCAIVTAGPVFNLIFAFVVVSFMIMVYGAQVPDETARIGGLKPGMPAAKAGLRVDDVVTAIDGQPVEGWNDLSRRIRGSGGREMELSVRRGQETLTIRLTAEEQPEKTLLGEVVGKAYLIGIEPAANRERVGPLEAVQMGASHTAFLIEATAVGLVKIVQGRISREDIGGPILIVQQAAQRAKHGLEQLLHLMALISVNLGILNLLPIPVLDGGHLLFFTVEAVMRRPLELRQREIMQQIGLVILVSLMAFAFYNDIARVITRGWGG